MLALVLVLEAISPATQDTVYTPQGIGVLAVIAFLLGYREETFRELIKRLVDTLVKPATQTVQAFVTLTPSAVDFGPVGQGTPTTATITLVNRTSRDIEVLPSGVAISGSSDVTHAVAAPFTTAAGSDSSISLTWTPTAAGRLAATLSVQAGDSSVTSQLTGTAT